VDADEPEYAYNHSPHALFDAETSEAPPPADSEQNAWATDDALDDALDGEDDDADAVCAPAPGCSLTTARRYFVSDERGRPYVRAVQSSPILSSTPLRARAPMNDRRARHPHAEEADADAKDIAREVLTCTRARNRVRPRACARAGLARVVRGRALVTRHRHFIGARVARVRVRVRREPADARAGAALARARAAWRGACAAQRDAHAAWRGARDACRGACAALTCRGARAAPVMTPAPAEHLVTADDVRDEVCGAGRMADRSRVASAPLPRDDARVPITRGALRACAGDDRPRGVSTALRYSVFVALTCLSSSWLCPRWRRMQRAKMRLRRCGRARRPRPWSRARKPQSCRRACRNPLRAHHLRAARHPRTTWLWMITACPHRR
jgi:hypothetical protein